MKCEDCIWGLSVLLALCLGWAQGQSQSQPGTNYTRPVFHCGGDMAADSGFVGSEGFPSYYKPNSKCTWRITVPEGNVVMLSFRIFDMEADAMCRYDYLDVYNGHSNMVQKLGRFCGTFRPGALISTTNTMMLEMVSDSETGGRGFLAYFNGGKPHVDDHQFCGGKMTKAQGEVKTPNWPEKNYPAGISCSWLVTVEPDQVIEVKFDKFDLESDSYCRFDYVAFFNGGEKDDSRRIGKYCGDVSPQTIVTNGNVLLVQFVSDLSVTSDGFMASYTSVPRGSRTPTVDNTGSGPRIESVPRRPAVKPILPERTVITTTTTTTKPPTTDRYQAPSTPQPKEHTVKPKPVKPVRTRPPNKPGSDRTRVTRPDGKRPVPLNPLCAKECKRDGNIKSSFCASEFVITGKVTALTPGPQGSVYIGVSLIKAYKAGRLTITQAGENMSVKLVSACKKCPVIRRGMPYILMGHVDEDGRGTMAPGAFTALYKAPYHKLLTNINNQPC
ncbi:procollagen C-endopeptidase enhancer 2 [Salmo trutta]|nr:procollagen C-endopeptidase enhancer 2-like [Salmo trutta]